MLAERELEDARHALKNVHGDYQARMARAAGQLQAVGEILVRSRLGEYVEEVRVQLLEGGAAAVKEVRAGWQWRLHVPWVPGFGRIQVLWTLVHEKHSKCRVALMVAGSAGAILCRGV